MTDFFQNGEVATFHQLKHRDLRSLEAELESRLNIVLSPSASLHPCGIRGAAFQESSRNSARSST